MKRLFIVLLFVSIATSLVWADRRETNIAIYERVAAALQERVTGTAKVEARMAVAKAEQEKQENN